MCTTNQRPGRSYGLSCRGASSSSSSSSFVRVEDLVVDEHVGFDDDRLLGDHGLFGHFVLDEHVALAGLSVGSLGGGLGSEQVVAHAAL